MSTVVRVPAHRSVLAGASDVFKVMFFGPLKEDSDINVTDANEAVFKEFLKFFYQDDQVEFSMENIAGLLDLGHKYNVRKCIDECAQFLTEILDVENVCSTLQLAIFNSHAELIKACGTFIAGNAEAVFKSVNFLECDESVLAHILKIKFFSCSEVVVFEACMSWVQAKSGQITLTKETFDAHLGDLFYEIRFRSMTVQEFCILTDKYLSVLSNDFRTVVNLIALPDPQSGRFNRSPRRIEWNEQSIIKCNRIPFGRRTTRISKLLSIEKKLFSSNKPLVLGRFKYSSIRSDQYSTRESDSNVRVEIQITESHDLNDTNSKDLLKMKANLNSESIVVLNRPILIIPRLFYMISIKNITNDDYFYDDVFKNEVTFIEDIISNFHLCRDRDVYYNMYFNKL